MKYDQHVVIYAKKTPSMVIDVKYFEIFKEIWNTKLSENNHEDVYAKKQIVNTCYGLLEKSSNRYSKSLLFDDVGSIHYYKMKNPGTKITCLRESKAVEQYELPDDEDVEVFRGFSQQPHATNNNLYVHTKANNVKMNEGFRFIKELQLQLHNLQIYKSRLILQQNDIDVYNVKSDAFIIKRKDVDKALEVLNKSFDCELTGVSQWRLSRNNGFIASTDKFQRPTPEEIKIEKPQNVLIPLTVEQEYDSEYLGNIFEEKKRVLLRAEYAGCGKSYL